VKLVEAALRRIHAGRRRHGLPHWVVLDEAHYLLYPGGVAEDAADLGDTGFCLATYRPSWLRPSLRQAIGALVLARTTANEELGLVRSLIADTALGERVVAGLPELPHGQFVFVWANAAGGSRAITFAAPPRLTSHVRHLTKYADSTVSPEARFFFRRPDGSLVATADSLRTFGRIAAGIDDEVLAWHAARGDFSRWVRDVFSDRELAAQLRKTESRWSRGEITDLRQAVCALIAARYGPERYGPGTM
jgi:hypothetical protein